MLIVLAILASAAAVAVPISTGLIEDIKLRGDAQSLTSTLALTKMTGATQFTRARLRVSLAAGTWAIEKWVSTGTPGWVQEGSTFQLRRRSQFGAGPVTTAPPGSQAVVAQPPACLADDGSPIAGTACLIYNSRGLPVTSAGIPTITQVIYINSPNGVFGIVVGAGGKLEVWRATLTPGGSWKQQ